ncbi:MAG: thiosulfate oxidation carrier complex protein SoxZ [Pseudomonadota bacterium]
MAARRVRIALPETAQAGELVQVKTLIAHPMETGYRRDGMGRQIPRDILTRFRCTYLDELVIDHELRPGISANPYLSFAFIAERTGIVDFVWVDQDGVETREHRTLTVR